jgi:hypothetical protein
MSNVISKRAQKRSAKTSGTRLVFQKNNTKVLEILTHEAARLYGAGTKWCITMERPDMWEMYTSNGSRFFFVLQGQRKTAIEIEDDDTIASWNEADEKTVGFKVAHMRYAKQMQQIFCPKEAEAIDDKKCRSCSEVFIFLKNEEDEKDFWSRRATAQQIMYAYKAGSLHSLFVQNVQVNPACPEWLKNVDMSPRMACI